MGAVKHSVIHWYAAEMTHAADLWIVESGQQPALVEHLGRPRGKSDTARLPAPLGPALADDDLGPAKSQFARQHEPDRPGAGNDYIGIHFRTSGQAGIASIIDTGEAVGMTLASLKPASASNSVY